MQDGRLARKPPGRSKTALPLADLLTTSLPPFPSSRDPSVVSSHAHPSLNSAFQFCFVGLVRDPSKADDRN